MAALEQSHIASSAKAGELVAGLDDELDEFDEDGLDGDEDAPRTEAKAETAGRSVSQPRAAAPMAEADDGSMVRIPPNSIYPGEPPYEAPALGFHPKIGALFDAFVYLPANGAGGARPEGFLPVIGLIGDSPEKDKSPNWKMYARIKPDVWKVLAAEIGEPEDGPHMPACVMVNAMRSENLAMFSIAKPHQLFATNAWMATMPLCVMRTPMVTVPEEDAQMLARAEKARRQLAKIAPDAKPGQQLSLAF